MTKKELEVALRKEQETVKKLKEEIVWLKVVNLLWENLCKKWKDQQDAEAFSNLLDKLWGRNYDKKGL